MGSLSLNRASSRDSTHTTLRSVQKFKKDTKIIVRISLICMNTAIKNAPTVLRAESFGAYELPQWETCQTTDADCLLDWENPLNLTAFSPPRKCAQGSVPNYYVSCTLEVQGIGLK